MVLKYFRVIPFLLPSVMMILLLLKVTERIDILLISLPTLMYLLHGTSNKNMSVISSNLFRAIRVLQIFILLHLFYVLALFSHIFIDCFTVNIQLILCLQFVAYYLMFPLTPVEKNRVLNFLGFFGFLLLFSTFISKMAFVDFNPDIDKSVSDRSFGILGDQEAWIFSIYASIFLFRQRYIYFLLFVLGILMNGSIGALVVVFFFTIYFLYTNFKIRYAPTYILGVLIVVTILFFSDLSKAPVLGRLLDFEEFATSGSAGHRLAALENTRNFLGEYFLLGWGNFSLYMQNQYKNLLLESEIGLLTFLSSSNNQIIDFYLHFGFVGLTLFILFLYRVYQFLKYNYNTNLSNGFSKGIYVWFSFFILFNQTATWFLPGGFILIIFSLYLSSAFSSDENISQTETKF